ncbi:MAG: hypothetical protein HYR96_02845 [Deltaproteobacteria bacterium]|nr:hypothetical protein [Deltaproteobacteria bacterium]MBI3294039.1 hypothetical protein [Deltaproteobacteria bacterium]
MSRGHRTLAALRKSDPKKMYNSLCRITGKRHDPCCLDVFRAAVEQAKNPRLPREKCNWWYWSKVRKQQVRA